jgi:hypothetical protein
MRRVSYAVTIACALAAPGTIAADGSAAGDRLLLSIAAGASTDGAIGRGEVASRIGFVTATVRADVAGAGDAVHATALAGVGPRSVRRPATVTRWNAPCLARLRAAGSAARCPDVARREASSRHTNGWLGVVAGARRTDAMHAIAALRIHPSDDILGDVFELGVSAVVDGRGDRLFVQHARFAPGWYARAQVRAWKLVIAAEIGTTGLAYRDADGRYRADVFASATLGAGVGL